MTIEELRIKAIHMFEDQPGYHYTSGRTYDWLSVVAPSGSWQEDLDPSGWARPEAELTIDEDSVGLSGIQPQSQRVDPPILKAHGSLDIRGFRRLMAAVLEVVQPEILFVPAYPDWVKPLDERTRTSPIGIPTNPTIGDHRSVEFIDTITFRVVSRQPGSLSNHARATPGGRREIKPRLREAAQPHRSSTNALIDIYGQWIDNRVQFDLFTRTNDEAEEFVEWFEDFMDTHTDLFMYAGVSKMHYYSRMEDQEISKWRTGLSVRSVQYYIRTERLFEVDVHRLKEINVRLLNLVTTQDELEALRVARQQNSKWDAIKAALYTGPD